MDKEKLIAFFRMKNNDLKHYLVERETVNSIKNELDIELNSVETYKNFIIDENNIYDEQIQKIKNSRKNITSCTIIFYIYIIIISLFSFINFLSPNFYFIIGSLPIMTIVYIVTIFKDMKFLKNNNIKFFKKQIYENNKQIEILEEKINILNKELKEVIKREFSLKKILEQYTLDLENMFSNNKTENLTEKEKIMIKK